MGTPCDRFTMKLNLSCPTTGMQKCLQVDDDKKLLPFFDKRIAQEISGDSLGDEFKCYRQRRTGEMKRKSVRGCIVSHEISVLNLVLVKKGEQEIPGLTDTEKPIRLGPKRATKIRKLFDLNKDDDVRKFVVRRAVTTKNGKEYSKAPKIQRLVTSNQVQRKRHRVALKRGRVEKNKKEQASYLALVAQRAKEAKDRRAELLAKRRSSHGSTHSASK